VTEELLAILTEAHLVWDGACHRWGFDPAEADIMVGFQPHPAGGWEVYMVAPTDLMPIDYPTEETQ
jgi:hypothetical protein